MEKVGISIPAWLLERKIICYYLIINNRCCWENEEFGELIQKAPEKRFYELISKHMNAFLQEGVMPPAEIAPAIMNLIDDQSAGRTMTLRAGDYIALQNHLRKSK